MVLISQLDDFEALMLNGGGSISFSKEPVSFQTCNISYLDNYDYKTIAFDEAKMPLVVNGTFWMEYIYYDVVKTSLLSSLFKWDNVEPDHVDIRVHIPYLPSE